MDDESGVSAEDTFYKEAKWSLQFAWLPHRCDVTGREIWFEWAYRGINETLSATIAYSRWITKDVWLIEKLKGSL